MQFFLLQNCSPNLHSPIVRIYGLKITSDYIYTVQGHFVRYKPKKFILATKYKIESAVYRVLYKHLCIRIWKELYKEDIEELPDEYNRDLLERIVNKPMGLRLIKGSPKSDQSKKVSAFYFYRRVVDLNTDTIRGNFDPYLLYNALVELEYKLDETYKEPNTKNGDVIQIAKTDNMLKQFIAAHAEEIREEQKKVEPGYYLDSTVKPVELSAGALKSSDPVLTGVEGTAWYIFYYYDEKIIKNGKAIKTNGVAWAILKCGHSGRAELSKKSADEEGAISIYEGDYSLSEDRLDLVFNLTLKGKRNLQLRWYLGTGATHNTCIGMASNVTEDFEAWAIVAIAAPTLPKLSTNPGFQLKNDKSKGKVILPPIVWEFLDDSQSTYLVVPRIGAGRDNIRKAISNRPAVKRP